MPDTAPALAFTRRLPNLFDAVAVLCILGALAYVAGVARGTLAPLPAPEADAISLDPAYLPGYAVRTTLRLFAAMLVSLLFTFTYAPLAAKSRRAGMVLIPVLDVLQSVPILGFLSFTVVFFLQLFPGRVLGAELAAIFAIFTSQAWNMAFSFYYALKTLPPDLVEAARAYRLSPWQRFWRLEVPFAMPGLVWNSMISMSGGWFFVVASEAVTVGDTAFKLPGIGSYVAVALEQRDFTAVLYAIGAMAVVILAYDQLLFRPLVAWSGKFRMEAPAGADDDDPWVLAALRRAPLLRRVGAGVGAAFDRFAGLRWPAFGRETAAGRPPARALDLAWFALLATLAGVALWRVADLVGGVLAPADVAEALRLGCYTLLRVVVLIALASLVWVPVGVWLGLRPAWAQRAQTATQFLAAFPANLFFPVFVVVIVRFSLDPDIWLTPLMVLGAQWYILFNAIAGAAALPSDLREAARQFRVGGWLRWRRVLLPGIAPHYVTGATAASGGAWNAAIVSEVASWGDTRLAAQGLGAYIARATEAGDGARVLLGVAVMAGFVVLLNRLLWNPLHARASRRVGAG